MDSDSLFGICIFGGIAYNGLILPFLKEKLDRKQARLLDLPPVILALSLIGYLAYSGFEETPISLETENEVRSSIDYNPNLENLIN